jgi:hypothetical protein
MAQKVIVPQKKNYVPQFLKQRDINSYFDSRASFFMGISIDRYFSKHTVRNKPQPSLQEEFSF